MMEEENVKNGNARPIILAIIGILIVVLIALGVVYKLRVVGDPVALTTIALEELGDNLENEQNYGLISDFLLDNDTVEANLTGNINMPMELGKLNINMLMQEDVDKKEAVMDLAVNLNGEEAIYLEGQLDREALYFAFKDNATKYYYLNDLTYPEVEELDVDSLLDKFIESFKITVNKDDFIETNKEIEINNEKITAKQYSLKLTNDLSSELFDTFFKKVENDKEIMKELAVLAGDTEEELKREFASLINDIKNSEANDELYYNLYVYKNTAVRFEIVDSTSAVLIDEYKYSEVTIKGTDGYDEDIAITLKEADNGWDLKVASKDVAIEGKIAKGAYNLNVITNDMTVKVNGTSEEKELNESVEATLNGNVIIEQQGTSITIPYDFNIKLKEIENVTLKNTTNKVDMSNMTEVQQNEFYSDLMGIPIIEMIMSEQLNTESNTVIY